MLKLQEQLKRLQNDPDQRRPTSPIYAARIASISPPYVRMSRLNRVRHTYRTEHQS
jgi:hypothetical protein